MKTEHTLCFTSERFPSFGNFSTFRMSHFPETRFEANVREKNISKEKFENEIDDSI